MLSVPSECRRANNLQLVHKQPTYPLCVASKIEILYT